MSCIITARALTLPLNILRSSHRTVLVLQLHFPESVLIMYWILKECKKYTRDTFPLIPKNRQLSQPLLLKLLLVFFVVGGLGGSFN